MQVFWTNLCFQTFKEFPVSEVVGSRPTTLPKLNSFTDILANFSKMIEKYQ